MSAPHIGIKRVPYEEPYHLNLLISVSDGASEGSLEYYCNTSDLLDIGNALEAISEGGRNEYVYEVGSTQPKNRWAYHFYLRALASTPEKCELQIAFTDHSAEPIHSYKFSITSNFDSVSLLGTQFLHLGRLNLTEFNWSPSA